MWGEAVWVETLRGVAVWGQLSGAESHATKILTFHASEF